uniref:histone deacetylase n=1 Tax=Oncorhynchus mykiss TaxID=8022 RepID=A0A8L0DQ11_ONCMY
YSTCFGNVNMCFSCHILSVSMFHLSLCVVKPHVATIKEMAKFHTDSRYLEHLHKISQDGDNDDPQSGDFGLGYDCPVVEGIYDYATAVGGATLTAPQCLLDKRGEVAIDWSGGWHHPYHPVVGTGDLCGTGLGKGTSLWMTQGWVKVNLWMTQGWLGVDPMAGDPMCSFNMTPVRRAQCLQHALCHVLSCCVSVLSFHPSPISLSVFVPVLVGFLFVVFHA